MIVPKIIFNIYLSFLKRCIEYCVNVEVVLTNVAVTPQGF